MRERSELPNIITLLTDFGLTDSYVGQLKGVIYSVNPRVRIVDLTHSVALGDLFTASFVLKTSYRVFPKGTIHLAVVDPGVGSERRPIIVVSPEYLFVGPDNGVFSHVYLENEVQVFETTNQRYFRERVSHTFHGRDVFAPVAAHLSLGVPPGRMGRRLRSFVELPIPHPKVEGGALIGEVVYADSFGNLITNIPREAAGDLEAEALVEIKGNRVEGVSESYVEKGEKELLAIWGSSDLLEISLSKGRADKFLGARRGEPVLVRTRKHNPEKGAPL